jgi:hypothetical protein
MADKVEPAEWMLRAARAIYHAHNLSIQEDAAIIQREMPAEAAYQMAKGEGLCDTHTGGPHPIERKCKNWRPSEATQVGPHDLPKGRQYCPCHDSRCGEIHPPGRTVTQVGAGQESAQPTSPSL